MFSFRLSHAHRFTFLVFIPPDITGGGSIMFSGCPSVCECYSIRPVNAIFHKPLGEIYYLFYLFMFILFYQIYNFGAVGDKDELIRF